MIIFFVLVVGAEIKFAVFFVVANGDMQVIPHRVNIDKHWIDSTYIQCFNEFVNRSDFPNSD